jgi:hypothetical protein
VPDRHAAEIAARQHGVISTEQLLAAGLTHRQIAVRVRQGRLFRVHIGVYAVGLPAHTPEARWMAATLATGGWLSHMSAAVLWGFSRAARPAEHVTVLRDGHRGRDGIVTHVVRRLDPVDRRSWRRIPVLTPARVLLDLAADLPPHPFARVLQDARTTLSLDDRAIRDVIARHPGRAGAPALAAALLGPFTRSELERRFLSLLGDKALPPPLCNAIVLGYEVDMWWPDRTLVVELDGRAAHGVTAADAAKDAALRAAGLTVLRFTWWDVVKDARRTIAALTPMLNP